MKLIAGLTALLLGAATAVWACGNDKLPVDPVPQTGTVALKVNDFLESLGIASFLDQGTNPATVAPAIVWGGWRYSRETDVGGSSAPLITMANSANIKILFFTGSGGGPNIANKVARAVELKNANRLLAVEGPNEPNNFPLTYQGVQGGSGTQSWLPIARFQSDFYAAVRANATLNGIPVFNMSNSGAQFDNTGLQCLRLDGSCPGASAVTLMPQNTIYAEYANIHNYLCTTPPNDNSAWNASDRTPAAIGDNIYDNYGSTWRQQFAGYSNAQILTLPMVTTETGWQTQGASCSTSQDKQGKWMLDMYLAQFKRGVKYTFWFALTDRNNQFYGVYNADLTKKLAADYIHNFTTILADTAAVFTPGSVPYTISNLPASAHDILMQKSNGKYELIVWGERITGSSSITVNLGTTRTNVTVYNPIIGTAAQQSLGSVGSVPLTVSDGPIIVEFN